MEEQNKKYCSKCEAENNLSQKFCGSCGASLDDKPVETQNAAKKPLNIKNLST